MIGYRYIIKVEFLFLKDMIIKSKNQFKHKRIVLYKASEN